MNLGDIELLHAIPGRVRMRVPEMKGNPDLAREIEKYLSDIKLVHRVEVNPLTGSVLVVYDPADSASIAALGRVAFPGLDPERLALQQARAEAEPGSPSAEAATEGIRGYFRDLNARVEAATGGADLKVLLPAGLFLLGVKNLVLGKKLAAPHWYDYLWFAFGTFFTLNGSPRPPAAEPPPPALAPTVAAVHVNGSQ